MLALYSFMCVVSQKLESCRCSDDEESLFFFLIRSVVVLTLQLVRDISDSEVETLITRREQIVLGDQISDPTS